MLISMVEPTKPMRTEAAGAGFYVTAGGRELAGGKYPRLQVLTIADLLAGKRIDYPAHALSATFKRAPRAAAKGPDGKELFEGEAG